MSTSRRIARELLGEERIKRLRRRYGLSPRLARVDFGDLRRVTPIDPEFGFARGLPVDRHYIRRFVFDHADDVRGRVLEFGDPWYVDELRAAGRASDVTSVDILHPNPDHPGATLCGDLNAPAGLPEQRFDCILCLQTILLIRDIRAAIRGLHQMLRPGGRLLLSGPGISRICDGEDDWWRLTKASTTLLLGEVFPGDAVAVRTYGNVLSAISFMQGIAAAELTAAELDVHDPAYELLIVARAQRPSQV